MTSSTPRRAAIRLPARADYECDGRAGTQVTGHCDPPRHLHGIGGCRGAAGRLPHVGTYPSVQGADQAGSSRPATRGSWSTHARQITCPNAMRPGASRLQRLVFVQGPVFFDCDNTAWVTGPLRFSATRSARSHHLQANDAGTTSRAAATVTSSTQGAPSSARRTSYRVPSPGGTQFIPQATRHRHCQR